MNKLILNWPIDLNITLLGGQSFAWDKIGDFYYGITQSGILKVKIEKENILFWQTYDENGNETNDERYIRKYFRFDTDYEGIIKKISKDKFIKDAISKNPGLKILSQDFEHCLLSFVLSSNNSIPNIRRSIRLMNKSLGKIIKIDGVDFYLFPKTKLIAKQSEEKLREFKMGFRAKYLLGTAKKLLGNDNIINLSEDDIRSYLISFSGVGEKIADCVMCFSLGFDNFTPIDTWAKKILFDLYKLDPKMKLPEIRNWLQEYFYGEVNFAGHFLFEYARSSK